MRSLVLATLITSTELIGPAVGQSGLFLSWKLDSDPILTADPDAPYWKEAPVVFASTDRYGKPVAGSATEIRSRWTNRNLYFLFRSRFESMRLTEKPSSAKETWGLWDFDVVEIFIGHDLEKIHLYKEFEVSPQDEWVDLEVDRERKGKEIDWLWNSNFRFKNGVDRTAKVWVCEMQIPWEAIAPKIPIERTEFRMNAYRIEGSDPGRKYMAWQAVHSPSYHTPRAFGRLRLVGKDMR